MSAPKIGVIGLPGKWSTETLADAIEEKTGFRLIVDMSAVSLDLTEGKLLYNDVNLCELDGLIIKKISAQYTPHTIDRLELLRVAVAAGVKVFSPPSQILRLIDRLSCTISLQNAGIPMPPTTITENISVAINAIKKYGEAVLKPLFSTKARGMLLVDKEDKNLKEILVKFQADNPVMYIQKKLTFSGTDLGLAFLNGQYLGAYARIAGKDTWNTTIHSGGRYESVEPSQEIIEIGQRAQSLFNLDFTTVDIAESCMGPIVFEVSAFGGFRGLHETTGINPAELYCEHVLKQIAC